MAFVLDINLKARKIVGLRGIRQQIAASLKNIDIDVTSKSLKGFTREVGQANRGLKDLQKTAGTGLGTVNSDFKEGSKGAKGFGATVLTAGKRYAGFLAATAVPFAGLAAIRSATSAILEFEGAIVRLDQILDQPSSRIAEIRRQILDLSVATGTSAKDIASIAQTLAQAGKFTAAPGEAPVNAEDFLKPLAQVPLLPAFESVEQAVEGVIAVMGQFGLKGNQTAAVIDKLNEVANRFATTSGDLVEGVKRGGAAFGQLGGNLNEFLAIFTAIRQTTRESASVIGTGLRTITTRLFRPKTLAFLKDIGVETRDAEGSLLGLIPIFRQLSEVFKTASTEQKRSIAETLGGFRQVGRVLAGLSNFDVVERALEVARTAAGSAATDAEKGLNSLGRQIDILLSRLNVLAQNLGEPVFVPFIKFLTATADAAIRLADALGPLLPVVAKLGAVFGTLKLAQLSVGVGAKLLPAISGLLAGGGIAAIAKGLQGAAAAAVPAVAGGTAPVVAGVAGAAAAAGAIARSPLGQFGLLALASGAADVAVSLTKTENASAKLAAEFLRATGLIVGVSALLSGKSVTDLFRGGGLAGGLVLGGAVAAAGLATALSAQANEEVKRIVDRAAEELAKVDPRLPAGGKEGFDEATAVIADKIRKAIQDAGEQFDPGTISGVFAQLGGRVRKLLSGDFAGAFEAAAVTAGDADRIIKQILGSSGVLLGKTVNAAIAEFGSGFRNKLDEQIAGQLRGRVADPGAAAKRIVDAMVTKIGGERGIDERLEELRRSGLAEEAVRIGEELSAVVVPEELAAELIKLTAVVGDTVRSINASVQTFDSLTATIGKISATRLPREVSVGAVRRGIAEGGLGGRGEFGNIDRAVGTINAAFRTLEEFVVSFAASGAVAELRGGVRPSERISDFVKDFLELKNVAPEVRGVLDRVLRNAGKEIDKAFEKPELLLRGDTSKIAQRVADPLRRIFRESFREVEGLDLVSDQTIQQFQALISAELARVQRELNAAALRATIENRLITGGRGGAGRAAEEVQRRLLRRGVIGRAVAGTETPVQNLVAGGEAQAARLAETFEAAVRERDRIFSELVTALREDAAAATGLIQPFKEAETQVIGLRQEIELFEAAARGAGSELRRTSSERLKQVKDDEGEVQNRIRRQARRELSRVRRDSGIRRFGVRRRDETPGIRIGIQERRDAAIERSKQRVAEARQTEEEKSKKVAESVGRVLQTLGAVDLSELDSAVEASKIQLRASSRFSDAVEEFGRKVNLLGRERVSADIRPGEIVRGPGGQTVEFLAPGFEDRIRALQAAGPEIAQRITDALDRELFGGRTRGEIAREVSEAQPLPLAGYEKLVAPLKSLPLAAAALARFAATGEPTPAEQARGMLPQRFQRDEAGRVERMRPALEALLGQAREAAVRPGTFNPENLVGNIEQLAGAIRASVVSRLELFRLDDASRKRLEKVIESLEKEAAGEPEPFRPRDIDPAVPGRPVFGEPGAVPAPEPGLGVERPAPGPLGALPPGEQRQAETVGRAGRDMFSASEAIGRFGEQFGNSVLSFSSVVATLAPNVLAPEQLPQLAPEQAAPATAELGTAIGNLATRLDSLIGILASQDDAQRQRQQAGQEPPPEIEIGGLGDATEATAANSDALSANLESQTALGTQLDGAASAMREGLNIQLDATQKIDVDVSGLAEGVEELKPEFRDLATRAAVENIREVLRQLAENAPNTDLSSLFNSVAV